MSKWQKVKIGDFLFERQGKFDPKDQLLFTYKKIEKIDFANGKIFLTDYSPTKTQQIIVRNGDFVFSGLNIEKGAVSINDLGIDLVVSTNYSTCWVDYSIIDQDFFKFLIKAPYFKTILKDNLKKDYGFTRPKHLLPLEINLPDLDTQREIAQKLHRIGDKYQTLSEKDNFKKSFLFLLRQQILQDAVLGKLTANWREKNPEIEPASKLLEKIKAEKEKLIAEKKIKKEKPLPKIAEDEVLFKLPETWEWCRLGEVFSSTSGGTPTRGDSNFWSKGDINWLKSGELNDGIINFESEEKITKKGLEKSSTFLFPKETVLIAMYGATAGKLAILDIESTTNQAICGFLKNNFVEHKFLFHFLRSARKKMVEESWGQAQPNISQTYLKSFLFPLPPLVEQKVIVAKIEKLMEHVSELEEKIKQNKQDAEMLMQSFLVEAFKN